MMSKKQKEQWLRVSTLRAEAPEGMSIQALLDALAALDTPTKEADSKTVAPPRLAILAKKMARTRPSALA